MPRDGTMPAPQPHPLETLLGQEWAASQLAQQHVSDVIGKIIKTWRADRARLAELETELAECRKAMAPAEPG